MGSWYDEEKVVMVIQREMRMRMRMTMVMVRREWWMGWDRTEIEGDVGAAMWSCDGECCRG